MIEVGSDFSGVGAFDQALMKLGINYKTRFSCDMDLYARETYMENYGEPIYYPFDVYDRIIPNRSLDIYMTSPPCQAFSLAGNRKGESDKRGILFYNSHEFIKKNKPKYFIFENVKGLLSDNKINSKDKIGQTFQSWITLLAGKSVNGVITLFPHKDSVPYHIYWKVLNAKNYDVPQSRERIFIVGIRDDSDNKFNWPKPNVLSKKLEDILQTNVDKKYYLSKKMLELIAYNGKSNGVIADLNKGGQKGEVFASNSNYMSCLTASDYKQPKQIQILSEEDLRIFNNAKIGAIRGRGLNNQETLEIRIDGFSNTITTVQKDNVLVMGGKIRRLTPREYFRLMNFPDNFIMPCSDSQMYKQAGNSIVVNVLAQIINNFNL